VSGLPLRHRSHLPDRTKIPSFDPPLPAVCTAYPTQPFLPFFHPPIELASSGPGSRLHLDRRVNFAAICFAVLARIEIPHV
jgi:hypothetical protein